MEDTARAEQESVSSSSTTSTNESVFPLMLARHWPYIACQVVIPGWLIVFATTLIIFKMVPPVTLDREL